jgi:hypothetical protein
MHVSRFGAPILGVAHPVTAAESARAQEIGACFMGFLGLPYKMTAYNFSYTSNGVKENSGKYRGV